MQDFLWGRLALAFILFFQFAASAAVARSSHSAPTGQIGMWIETGAQGEGQIAWMDENACTNPANRCRAISIPLMQSPFLITDYFTHKNQSNSDEPGLEAVRSEGRYHSNGRNIKGYIPKGSLVAPTGRVANHEEYQAVKIVSVATELAEPNAEKTLVKADDNGFLFRRSLQSFAFLDEDGSLLRYSLLFSPSPALEKLKSQGLDLTEYYARPVLNAEKNAFSAVEYCAENSCAHYMLFELFSRDGRGEKTYKTLAVSSEQASILQSAFASLEGSDKDGSEEDDSSESEDVSVPAGSIDSDSTGAKSSTSQAQSAIAKSQAKTKPSAPLGKKVKGVAVRLGTPDQVACFASGKVAVYDFKLTAGKISEAKVVDTITSSGTKVVKLNSWSGSRLQYSPDQKKPAEMYEKVQYGKSNKVGWIAEASVKLASECKTIALEPEIKNAESVSPDQRENGGASVSGPGFVFPLYVSVVCFVVDCGSAGRFFGAPRSNGRRRHGASDLIAKVGSKVRASCDGVILQKPYRFNRSWAIEQRCSGSGMIIRYGEVSGAYKVRAGQFVKKGALIGYVGVEGMVHAELYSGKGGDSKKRGLTDRSRAGGKYQRRFDLVNPTQSWLRALFASGLHVIPEAPASKAKSKKSKTSKRSTKSKKSKKPKGLAKSKLEEGRR